MAEEDRAFIAWIWAGIYFRMRHVVLVIPPVQLAAEWVHKCDFILKPEQGPFARVLASGNFPHVSRASDSQDKQAGNTVTLQELVSDVI